MRLLVVSSVWPHVTGSLEAANVVSYSILSEFARSGEFELYFAYVNTTSADIPTEARLQLDDLEKGGVELLDPLLLPAKPRLAAHPLKLLKAIFSRPALILCGYGAGEQLQAMLKGRQVDAVLTIWSEIGLNVASDMPTLRFAYHGNPDHKVFDAQHEVMRLVGVQPKGVRAAISWVRRALLRNLLERAHLSVLRRYDFVADVAANDATYYSSKGVNASYLCNMWPTDPPDDWEAQRDRLEQENPGKIVGSVGNTSATGNSLGFVALGQEVLPALKRSMRETSFQIHIFGGREPKSFLRSLLDDPHIVMRGFVHDLDAEIMSAPVFLISNNHHRFKVGHTRFLHAWSLGACVVAFADCRIAMPEIEHGHNALLGNTPAEVADQVAEALRSRDLRRKIGRGGMETLRRCYSPAAVTGDLIARMRATLVDKESA